MPLYCSFDPDRYRFCEPDLRYKCNPKSPIQTPQMTDLCLKFLSVGTGIAARGIAVRAREGSPPGLFWLGGFKSDMKGTKAQALDQWARDHGRAMTRFDYSGHGESGGNFTDGTIGSRPGKRLRATPDLTQLLGGDGAIGAIAVAVLGMAPTSEHFAL